MLELIQRVKSTAFEVEGTTIDRSTSTTPRQNIHWYDDEGGFCLFMPEQKYLFGAKITAGGTRKKPNNLVHQLNSVWFFGVGD